MNSIVKSMSITILSTTASLALLGCNGQPRLGVSDIYASGGEIGNAAKVQMAKPPEDAAVTARSYVVLLANMSPELTVHYVSVDNGAWAEIKPPIDRNCSSPTFEECTKTNQFEALILTNCGSTPEIAVAAIDRQGQWWKYTWPRFTANCTTHRGIVLGLSN